MPVEWQNVSIDLTGGLDQKSDSKYVLPGALTVLENARHKKNGRIEKRCGYRKILDITGDAFGSFLPNGVNYLDVQEGLGLYASEDFLIANFRAYEHFRDNSQQYGGHHAAVYIPGASSRAWTSVGPLVRVKVDVEPVSRSDQYGMDKAAGAVANNTQVLTVFQDSLGRQYLQAIDRGTKAVISRAALSSSSSRAHAVKTLNDVLMAVGNQASLRATYLSSSGALSNGAVIASSVDFFDAMTIPGLGAVVAVAIGASIEIFTLSDTGAPSSVWTVTAAASVQDCFNLYTYDTYDGDQRVGVFYGDGANLLSTVWTAGGGVHRTASTVLAYGSSATITRATAAAARDKWGINPSSGNIDKGMHVAWIEQSRSSPEDNYVSSISIADDGVVVGRAYGYRGFGVYSRAFTAQDKAMCWLTHSSDAQGSMWLVAGFNYTTTETFYNGHQFLVARALYGRHPGPLTGSSFLASVNEAGGDVFVMGVGRRLRLLSDGEFEEQGALCVMDFSPKLVPTMSNQGKLYGGGGQLWGFDGEDLAEVGHNLFPNQPQVTASSSTGGGITDGERRYVVVMERVDRNGNLHRSAPSAVLTHTASGGTSTQKFTVESKALQVSLYDSNEAGSLPSSRSGSLALYRTKAGGATYYRVNVFVQPAGADGDQYWSFEDTVSDSDLSDNEILYTTGGELEDYSAGPVRYMAANSDRVLVVCGDEPNRIYVAKQRAYGEAIAFNPNQFLDIYPGGEITGLSVLDDNFVVFGENEIRELPSVFQNDLGQGQNADDRKISTGKGHLSDHPLIETHLGVLFWSRQGLHLLDRSRSAQFIGGPIEDFNDKTVIAGGLMRNYNGVYYAFDDGTMTIYELEKGTWTSDTGMTNLIDAGVFRGELVWMDSSGEIFLEDKSIYTDDGVAVAMRFKTGWISPAGIQGYQRTRRLMILGEKKSDFSMTVKIYQDYDETTPAQTLTITSTGIGLLQERIRLNKQKCESIMIEIIDIPDVSGGKTGESFTISNISMEVGIKGGLYKKASTGS